MPSLTNHTLDSELVIGLVGAVGTRLKAVIELLNEQLFLAGYSTNVVKVSEEVIKALCDVPDCEGDAHKRISDLMCAGNKIREKTANNGVLALGVAAKIYAERDKEDDQSPQPLEKTAFIVDSLKRPEEVEVLRQVYPSGFILVGAHEEQPRRFSHLLAQGMTAELANELIRRDGEEAKAPSGQRLNNTFHLADFFVRITGNQDRLEADVRRMVELWFGNPFITPTFAEYAMFLAFAAGLRSADLSRQVGAVVTRDRQVLSTGANDCPQAGGGLYWPERFGDGAGIRDVERGRDYMRGEDSNRTEQLRIIEQIATLGKSRGFGMDGDKVRELLENSRIGDLTEFGRMVHAEMEALLACARAGISTCGATVYCTTFPCHNCAKHIVAAGIERVVYIEPYPKSKALEFHDDSIVMGAQETPEGRRKYVVFEPFVGIGPRRFFDLFSMRLTSSYEVHRKDRKTGKKKDWDIKNSRLRIQMQPSSYLDSETLAAAQFNKIQEKHFNSGEPDHDKQGQDS